MTKNIIIEDGLCLIDGTGPGQYTKIIIETLKNLNYKIEIPRKKLLEKIKNKNLRRILYLIWLNTFFLIKLIFSKKGSIVIYTNYSIPFIKIKKIIQIPVIHDLCSYLYPNTMTNIQNFYSIMATNNAIKNGDKIITVSNTVKSEIINKFKITDKNVFVVNCSNTIGLNENINENPSKIFNELKIQTSKYILSVSTFNKRKNLIMLINAFNILSKNYPNLKLVLVGGNGNDGRIKHIQHQNKNIIFTGYISDKDLSLLYKNALIYVFPSLYEGFGIPIIDAQNFGVPVICSNIPIFREIAGQGAEFFDLNVNSIIEKLEFLIKNEERRKQLTILGKINIDKFKNYIIENQINVMNENI